MLVGPVAQGPAVALLAPVILLPVDVLDLTFPVLRWGNFGGLSTAGVALVFLVVVVSAVAVTAFLSSISTLLVFVVVSVGQLSFVVLVVAELPRMFLVESLDKGVDCVCAQFVYGSVVGFECLGVRDVLGHRPHSVL